MLFNSIGFIFFLPTVYILYWCLARKLKSQNVLLLGASYFFYACWDWRFLFLLIFSTLLDYYTGIKIYNASSKKRKSFWLWLSLIINLGFLGVFKYYNFFVESFADGLSLLGIKSSISSLNVILPVGISFYTFHGLSYIIDVYKNRILPERNFINYSVFVSFFPLLVAGPIERATHLLPQIIEHRKFDYSKSVDGLRQILWGFFKKIVIADNCAEYANLVFNNPDQYSGSSLLFGAIFFSFQIYCDFSGYSDIALGVARLFGIELLRNFAFPYFSRDIAEFWRRWHISLSSWFKDYLYIPIGGSKASLLVKIRNVFIIFIVSGLWHGANWTFVFWGIINAIYVIPSILLNSNRSNLDIVAKGKYLPSFKEFYSILITYTLTVFAWIFFRSTDIQSAFDFFSKMFSHSFFTSPFFLNETKALLILCISVIFFLTEWIGRESQYAIQNLNRRFSQPLRWCIYYALIFSMFYFGGKEQEFIYFKF